MQRRQRMGTKGTCAGTKGNEEGAKRARAKRSQKETEYEKNEEVTRRHDDRGCRCAWNRNGRRVGKAQGWDGMGRRRCQIQTRDAGPKRQNGKRDTANTRACTPKHNRTQHQDAATQTHTPRGTSNETRKHHNGEQGTGERTSRPKSPEWAAKLDVGGPT